LKIFKVFTQVTNGVFIVDMEFVGKHPRTSDADKRCRYSWPPATRGKRSWCPGVDFTNRLEATGSFKVAENGKIAYKVDIQLGNQNTDYYEVLQDYNQETK
jgi:HlyD family secretion protein